MELREALADLGDLEYDVDDTLMALLLTNYKLMEVIKESFGRNVLDYVLDETESLVDVCEGKFNEKVIDCALNNIQALKAITVHERANTEIRTKSYTATIQ